MTAGRSWWLRFTLGAACVILAMAGVTTIVLRLEYTGVIMRAEADRNSELRAALWHMDSWLVPHLGREAFRPPEQYRPYYATQNIYTRFFSEIEPGDVFTPSPLLTFESDYFPIHFQISRDGGYSSPQIPTGNELDLAQSNLLSGEWIEEKSAVLAHVETLVDYPFAALCCTPTTGDQRQEPPSPTGDEQNLEHQQTDDPAEQQRERNQGEYQQRAQVSQQAQRVMDWSANANRSQLDKSTETEVRIDAFVPVWIEHEGESDHLRPDLVFLREVTVAGEIIYQGFLCDWPAIHAELVRLGAERFPGINVVPSPAPIRGNGASEPSENFVEDDGSFRLASVPAIIQCAALDQPASSILTTTRAMLGVAWIMVLVAIGAVGMTLRSSIHFGERRSRFASAVTHELRTPLTTFQMYSEMLADGMVTDPDQQKVYHETLREESTRLSALVENVLAYARVEDGRAARNIEPIEVGPLFQRFLPSTQRRVEKDGLELVVDLNDSLERTVTTDADTVGQIVFNLVDNACKYGCPDGSGTITLAAKAENTRLVIRVCDEGPGIGPELARRIFQPFDRGTIEPGTEIPGIGLGLSLCRELAATLGGSLSLTSNESDRGACFTLSLPLIGS